MPSTAADEPAKSTPQLTWANIISTLVLGSLLMGAGWTVMLTLLTAERERTSLINTFNEKEISRVSKYEQEKANALADFNKERRDLLQQQIDRRESEINRRLVEITGELVARRSEFISIREFSQFQVLISQLRDQIKIIEQTRPTTGELQAVGNGNKDQITKLEDRVRSLEDNLRTLKPIVQPPK